MLKAVKDSGLADAGGAVGAVRLRSRSRFDSPSADMSALYLERYTNFGLSIAELQSNRPIIGIAQTGSDMAPCNRHHLVLAERVRDGIREAGGIPIEFPVHPIQETDKRPTACLMAAATVNIPAIALSVGPMLFGLA